MEIRRKNGNYDYKAEELLKRSVAEKIIIFKRRVGGLKRTCEKEG
jgi:ribosomal protein S18